jgi:preprotein translocase subunit SecB
MVTTKRRKKGVNPGLMVSDRVQLRAVRLASCHCDQKPAAVAGKKAYNITYSTKVQPNKKNSLVVVIATFHFEAFAENQPQKPALRLDASFVLAYQLDNFEGLTQEGFQHFANLNGIYNAWPYWREFVQNMVGRMGLPPLTIPVFRIVQTSPKAKASRKTNKRKAKKVK